MHCKVADQVLRVFRCLDEERRKPNDYGSGVPLYHAEVMFLELLARYPEENVSRMAERLGITKGAVTQLSQKLLQKELIVVSRKEGNRKEKSFQPTAAGQEVIAGHQRMHQQANEKLCDYVSTLKPEESRLILQFLDKLLECGPFCQFPCRCKAAEDAVETACGWVHGP